LLSNITDYLIEEASAEEEELLGKSCDLEEGEEGGETGNAVVRDEDLIKVLVRKRNELISDYWNSLFSFC
jgi:hypothetical protein